MRTRLLVALCVTTLAPLARAQDRQPNVVILLADDLGWGELGFNGRTEWQTPYIDRLASQGTRFRRWYSGGAVCAPSRGVLLTGKYTIHNGVSANGADLPASEVTIAEALKPRGYITGLFGKWHHGSPRAGRTTYVHPMDQGFDEFFGFTNAREAWEHFPKKLWFGREERPVSGYADTLFNDHAIDFMRRNRDRPFFLYVAYTAPHRRIEAPAEDIAEHRGRFREKDLSRPLYATYAAQITRLDKEVGRLVKALDELKLSEQTIVIFTSDQGATFETDTISAAAFHDSNRPFRGQKRNLWEGGVRVPAFVRWPGHVPAGVVSSEITHMIDVMPSVVAAGGGAPEPEWRMDGTNMLPVWLGREKAPARTLFFEWRSENYNQIAAMRGDLKLVITGDNPAELFNVETDLAERRTLAAEYPELVKELRQALKEWLATETVESKEGNRRRTSQSGSWSLP
jgi:arylsulfatase A